MVSEIQSTSAYFDEYKAKSKKYKTRIIAIKKLERDNLALLKRIDRVEHRRDSLSASLAALDPQDTTVRCEKLEEECKTLEQKVVSLHKNNTEIKIKLESYHQYAKKREQQETSSHPQEKQMRG